MSGEKILILGDSIEGPTGFANNLSTIAWSLAKEYDVHVLGLQSVNQQRVKLDMEGEIREITQHPNLPRGKDKWDFGTKSLPRLMKQLQPDILFTLNDIQMIQHVPNVLYPNMANIKMIDFPSKKMVSRDALIMELDGHIQRFKEKYPLDTKWIAYCPEDGDPPMQQWKNIYSMADKCVAFGKYGKDLFKQYFNMDVPYIYHSIDSANFENKEKPDNLKDKFVIGNFNRNQPRKQPVRTMMAFAKFAKDKPDALLHMQMDWNDQFGWPIQYFAQLYGIMNKMIQPRQVGMPRKEVSNTYNMWDLNVNSHGGEGFGIVAIEGMKCGLPYISTDYTTSRELTIDGKPSPRGIVVQPKELYWEKMDVAAVQRAAIDVDKLADAFNTYYYNKDLLKEHGENGEVWVKKNCLVKNQQNKWLKLIKETLSMQDI